MTDPRQAEQVKRKLLVRRFWTTARRFWTLPEGKNAWLITLALVAIIVLQLLVQYRINVWNRSIFDALEQKNAGDVLFYSALFVPLALSSIALAVAIVYVRMTTQRRWRRWMAEHLIDRWLTNGRYYHLNLMRGEHENPEYRIAEDLRVATESPIDFASGILAAFLSAVTFIGVLWFVGGSLTFSFGGTIVTIPGFLVIAAMTYAVLASGAMIYIGRRYVIMSEAKLQAEAEFRYALTRLRENGESIALIAGEDEEKIGLTAALLKVIRRWRDICFQYMRTMTVAQSSFLIAPVIPVILSSPKYLDGTMSLGQVMQAASAFVTVQTAFNWLVDNYPRLADWTASARRVTTLLVALDGLEKAEQEVGMGRITHGEAPAGVELELRNVSVTLDDGKVVVGDTDVKIARGEKVLVVGESGAGKSTLVRAIAGLWPWGDGEILTRPGTKMFLMPQRPYIPLGPLRRAAIYPMAADSVSDEEVKQALIDVGLEELSGRINEDSFWDLTLSGGEKQRVAFARLLIHKPDVIVMDEATSALDRDSQDKLLRLIEERLPATTVISVGHRPELEAFHQRKLVLEYRREGARIVHDESLLVPPEGLLARLRRLFKPREKERAQA